MSIELDSRQLKLGWQQGGKVSVPLNMGASEVFNHASGKFVKLDANGRGEVAGDGDTALFGWVEAPAETTSATEGGTTYNCIVDLTAIFRIPVNTGTYVESMVGKTCDLSVASGIQGAQLDASVEDTVIIVDGDAINNRYVDVKLNPATTIVGGVV